MSNDSPQKKFPENYDTTDYVLPTNNLQRTGPAQKSPHESIVAKMTNANMPKASPMYKTLTTRGPSPQPMKGSSSSRQLLFQKKNSVQIGGKKTSVHTRRSSKPVVIPAQKLKKTGSSKENF